MTLLLCNCISSLQVHTDVVNRKTTITTFPDITFCCSVHSSESDEENMARGKRYVKRYKSRSNAQIKLRNNKPKSRSCDSCYKAVGSDVDIYRFYHTGLTVCKNCWITTDPSSDKTRRSRQVQSNLAEIKLCTVILTDVLNQESYKKKKVHQVEKNKDDNTSVDSSQEEAKFSESSPLSVSFKTRNHLINGKARRGRKRKIDMIKSKDEYRSLKMTRLNKERINTNEIKLTKASIDTEQQSSTRFMKTQGVKRMNDDRSSDSDNSVGQRETHKNKLNDRVNKTHKKKHKSTHEEITSNLCLDFSDETSNEDSISLRSKTKDATSSSNVSSQKEGEERSTRSRTRSSSLSSIEISPQAISKLSQSEVKIEYACDKCNKKFDTKLSNAKHRLTHLKQAALKLKKIIVSSVKEKQETEIDLQDDKISIETASCSGRTTSDKQTDPSEEISIDIENDTDDEEIFSVVPTKKKISEDGNVIDKSDTTKSEEEEESHLEEESKNDENIETKEFESTVSNETLEIEDDEDANNTRNKHTTKTKNKISANKDSDRSKDKDTQEIITVAIVEDHNADEEENKDVELENDETVCSTEKEKINSECNDEEDLHEEITRDSERIESPILSSRNKIKAKKDHSKSGESNLQNNCDNDEDEIIEESEICDLIDESSQKDTKEPEEEVQKTDKIETFNDERDLDDIVIINEDKEIEKLEERENESNEKNMEIDEPNGIQDTTEPELSNEKQDEIKDCDENDTALILINSDINDDRSKFTKTMEEIALTDNSKLEEEKEKFEEQLKELEEMVNDNVINNKHREVPENSTYILDSTSADAANEILKEVFELAAAEVQHREENSNTKNLDDVEMETLENISREIRKSADMPSLDPISVMEIDDDMLN